LLFLSYISNNKVMVVFDKELRMKTLAVCAGLLAVFFIISCGPAIEPTPGSKLRGTWVSNDPKDYNGTVVISISSSSSSNNNDSKNSNGRITITGYSKDQTPSLLYGGDDNKRPFKDFTKGSALPCRWDLEEGKLFITDRGKEQEGIPFVYYEGERWLDSSSSTGYRRDKFICFTFGGREEILENSENFHIQEPPPENTP
jgi:hypothetical protein